MTTDLATGHTTPWSWMSATVRRPRPSPQVSAMRRPPTPAGHPVVAEAVNRVHEVSSPPGGVVWNGRDHRKLLTSAPPWTWQSSGFWPTPAMVAIRQGKA